MNDSDYHALTQFQAWGRDTLRWAGLSKKFEGRVVIELSFRQGELMEGFNVEIRQRIAARPSGFEKKIS